MSLVEENPLQGNKRETEAQTQPQNFWPTICTYLQDMLGKSGIELMGIANQDLIWLKVHSMRQNPTLDGQEPETT